MKFVHLSNFWENYQNVRYYGGTLMLIVNLQNPAFPDLKNYCTVITFQYWAIHSFDTRNSKTGKQNCLKLPKVLPHKFYPSLLVCLAFIFYHMLTFIRYIEVHFTFALGDFVRYNEDFVKSRFCFLHFTAILAGPMKIVCYTEDFVI